MTGTEGALKGRRCSILSQPKVLELRHNSTSVSVDDTRSTYEGSRIEPDTANTDHGNILDLELLVVDMGGTMPDPKQIGLCKASYVHVMEALQLSSRFLSTLCIGSFAFQEESKDNMFKYTIRAPLANSCNWTLSLSYHHESLRTSALLHGLQAQELRAFEKMLDDFKHKPIHPMLLPTLLCELTMHTDSNMVKRHETNIHEVERLTSYFNYRIDDRQANDDAGVRHIEELTLKLNAVVSRLAFHEKRLYANISLTLKTDAAVKHLRETLKSNPGNHDYIRHPDNLCHRLENIQDEARALIVEISSLQKVAQSQLQVVYNLSALNDNRENLKQARASAAIASLTEKDGFAMKTIAVMTIAFLPGTAVSSLFSTELFHFDGETNKRMLSSHFWVYWAVSIPLTITVLVIWRISMGTHKSRSVTSSDNNVAGKYSFYQGTRPRNKYKVNWSPVHQWKWRLRANRSSQRELENDLEANILEQPRRASFATGAERKDST